MNGLLRFGRRDEAIAATEYGMLIAMIAVVLIAVVSVFGPQIGAWFASKTGQITTV
jgi:Flp pilus assembly pilin Flp